MEDWRNAQQGPTGSSRVPDAPPRREPSGVPVGGSLVRHRPWSTVLLVVHALGVAAGVGVLGYGVVLVVAGFAPPPEPVDGIYEPWGIFLGGLLIVLGVGVLAVAAVLTVLTVHGRRAADQGRPGSLRGLAITTVVLAGTGVVGSFMLPAVMLPVELVICAVYALPGVLVARSTRATWRA